MMQVYRGLPPADFAGETALALGFFDGVHRGHQKLLQAVKKSGLPCGVLTFKTVPKKAVKPIQSEEEKLHLLQEFGMDFVIMLPFTDKLSCMLPQDFIREILKKSCHAKGVVVGENYRFGVGAQGTAETLKRTDGLSVTVCPLLQSSLGIISSSLIRQQLAAGRVDLASELLGHPYCLSGKVIHGEQLGSTMGMPTVNLAVPDLFLPKGGVYETRVTVGGQQFPAVTNIGVRPTVSGKGLSIESHLLQFDRMVYGEEITVSFVRFLREEQKFSDKEALFRQICADKEAVLKEM